MRAHQVEIDLTDDAAQTIADRMRDQSRDARTALQRFVGLGRAFRLGGKNIHRRMQRMRRGGRTADQTAATDRRDQGVERTDIFDQFERRSTLTCDHGGIGKRMYECRAGFAAHLLGARFARGECRRAVMQRCAIGRDRGQLGLHRAFGYHDMRGDSARARRERERGAVIAR